MKRKAQRDREAAQGLARLAKRIRREQRQLAASYHRMAADLVEIQAMLEARDRGEALTVSRRF